MKSKTFKTNNPETYQRTQKNQKTCSWYIGKEIALKFSSVVDKLECKLNLIIQWLGRLNPLHFVFFSDFSLLAIAFATAFSFLRFFDLFICTPFWDFLILEAKH